MNDTDSRPGSQDGNIEHPDDDLSEDEVASLMGGVEVTIPGDGTTIELRDMMTDIMAGHFELDTYKRGALTFCDALDERITVAENNGEDDLAELLYEVRSAAFGLYLRVQRGDQELLGEREGEYSGFFESEADIPSRDPQADDK